MTMQEFIGRNPDSTLNLMTPSGYITLTPEMTKALLQGKPVLGHAGTNEARQPIPAEYLLHQELVQIHPHKTIPHYYGAITDDKVPIRELKRLETIDLSYCILRGKDFTGYHFDGANFRGARLENVNFQDAVFLNCDLSEARFTSCQLDDVVMVNNDCFVTVFEECSISRMRMKDCNMGCAETYGFDITDIQMDDLTQNTIRELQEQTVTIAEGSPMRIISQKELEVMCAKHVLWLHGEGGEQADFSGCRLTDLDMSHTNFNGAIFDGVTFDGVDLTGTYLCHAKVGGAEFLGCNLFQVYADESDFSFSSFKTCNLQESVFSHSNLRCVTLENTSPWKMIVRNSCLENSQLLDYAHSLVDYDTAHLTEEEWLQELGMPGMGGMV